MRVQDIIKASKLVVDWGKPKLGGMMASVFPLSKRKRQSLRLGSLYKWRLIKFQALGETFRLLVAYHTKFDNYEAYLGAEVGPGPDLRLIATYSYHGTHPGWHMHAGCGDMRTLPIGVLRHPWLRRIPQSRSFVRRTEYVPRGGHMDDNMALYIAVERFNLYNKDDDLFGRRPKDA